MSKARRKQSRGAKTRKRETGIALPQALSEGSRSFLRELCAILLGGVAAFLLLSIISHELTLARLWTLERPATANIMGPLGYVVSTVLFGVLGWASILPSIVLAAFAVRLWASWNVFQHEESVEYGIGIRSAALFFSLLLCSAFLALVAGSRAGGELGEWIARPIGALFGGTGSLLVCGLLFIFTLAVISDLTLVRFTSGALRATTGAFWFCLTALWSGVGNFVQMMVTIAGKVYDLVDRRAVLTEYDEELDEEEHMKPRKKFSLRSLEGEADVVDPDIGHDVVINRARKPSRASKRELKRARERVHLTLEEAFAEYEPPALSLLRAGVPVSSSEEDSELKGKSKLIEQKLADFQIRGRVTHVHPGPVITLFEFEPAPGVKVGRIAALQDDLAMSLRASSIRIIAPIPRRGTVGIEVPNKTQELVRLRDLLESEVYLSDESLLSVPLGKDTYGNPVVEDVAKMPHLLMAGATGTGKSVCINAFLVSLLYRTSPAEVGLILIDPKILELSVYDGIPHLRVPVVTDPRKARAVLLWAVQEMERRYRMMQKFGVRSIDGYNRLARGDDFLQPEDDDHADVEEDEGIDDEYEYEDDDGANEDGEFEEEEQRELFQEKLEALPKIVIVIDELADLMLTSGREVEELITRLAQKARASGIHLVIATQRPSVDVITGLIKANFPARLSFRVSSRIDSRTILDSMGAERLLGKGDMLYLRPGGMHLTRVHGAFVSDSEVARVVEHLRENCKPRYDEDIIEMCEKALESEGSGSSGVDGEEEYDQFYDRAVQLVLDKGQASTSMIQRAFRIGYNRAARIVEVMEREGIIGPMDGAKPREVLVDHSDVENG